MNVYARVGVAESRALQSEPSFTPMGQVELTLVESSPKLRQLPTQDPQNAIFSSYLEILNRRDLIHLPDFEERLTSQLAIGLQRESEFRSCLDYHILKMLNSGLMRRMQIKWMLKHKPDDLSHRIFASESSSLGLDNLMFPVLILVFGVTLSSVIALTEPHLLKLRS